MHIVDYILIVLYLAGLLYIGVFRHHRDKSASDLIVGGRMLTLPAFVASLVSTWYGGILGVGEYSFKYGLSNWLVFGLPYYLAALLFALFLAKKARQSKLLTIPDRLAQIYDTKTAVAGSVVIYLMTIPAAYILMLGVLGEFLFGWPFWVGVLLGTIFSVVYVFAGGFRAVVRTDLLQFGLMFAGFSILLITLVSNFGGLSFLKANVPATHLTWHGGNSGWYIAIWYVIALATLIEPAFYQRCYAARTANTARTGIFISIACWAFFDFMTTSCGLYARALLPNLSDPLGSYPALALLVLPAGLMGIFALSLLSTVMSTVDSYSFIAASTFGNDIIGRIRKLSDRGIIIYTQLGLLISALLAIVVAVFFRSAVDIWHAFGSIGTPALLIPVFFSFVGRRRLPPGWAFTSILLSGGLSALWLGAKYFRVDGSYWFGVEPIFPGLVLSIVLFVTFSTLQSESRLRKK
ncbi:MAG: sodium:solute symporter family protein [candidate division Zixibacteria bacterium]|nr:sodium:solute symporter family protein [candidate division Zixibacteria bacterium]